MNNIDYELMEEKLRRTDDIDEDLLSCMRYSLRAVTRRKPFNFTTNPVLDRLNGSETMWSTATVEAPSDEAELVTSARGAEVKNSFGDFSGLLDPGATLAKTRSST